MKKWKENKPNWRNFYYCFSITEQTIFEFFFSVSNNVGKAVSE